MPPFDTIFMEYCICIFGVRCYRQSRQRHCVFRGTSVKFCCCGVRVFEGVSKKTSKSNQINVDVGDNSVKDTSDPMRFGIAVLVDR